MTLGTLTRRDIVRSASVPNDVVTFWLRAGLIIPIQAGSGKGSHLRFTKAQAKVAAFLAQGRNVGLNLDALRAMSAPLRLGFEWIEAQGVDHADWFPLFDSIHDGSEERRIQTLMADLKTQPSIVQEVVPPLLLGSGLLALHRTESGEWLLDTHADFEGGAPYPFCVVFDLERVLEKAAAGVQASDKD